MEPSLQLKKDLKLLEIKGADPSSSPQILISLPGSSELINLTLGESQEIRSNTLQIHIKQAEESLGFANVEFSEEPSQWISIGDSFSLNFAVTPSKSSKKPHIFGLAAVKPASCVYLKKLQEIEDKEREISQLMLESKHKIPENYREVLDSSPRSSVKRPLLKKKTLETEAFPEWDPDFSFEAYFNINLENVSSNEPTLLQHAAIGLLHKVRALRLDVEDYQLLQESLYEFEAPMQSLVDSVKESKEQLLAEEIKVNHLTKSVGAEIESIESEITATEDQNNHLRSEIQKISKEAEEISLRNQGLLSPEDSSEASVTSSLRGELSKVLLDIQTLEQQYTHLASDFARTFPEQEMAVAINDKVLRLSELLRLTNTRDFTMQEGIQLQAEFLTVEAEVNIEADLRTQHEDYRSESSCSARNNKHVTLQLLEILEEKHGNIRNSEKELEECRESLQPLESMIGVHQGKILERQESSLKSGEELEEILKNNSQLESILDREKQIIVEFEDFKKKFLNSNLIQSSLLDDLEFLGNGLLKVSESSLTSGRLLRRADDMIEEQELQQLSMYKLIALIKETKPAHIAVQNDPTDMALAKYLNARHKTLEVNFRRTEKDKYCFGSMKVEVKNEEDIVVITDGRKLKIEEFLESYTAAEKEKTIKKSNSKVQEKKLDLKATGKIGKTPLIPLGQILKKAK